MSHPQEIESEIALLEAELANTRKSSAQRAAVQARISELQRELAGYRPFE